MSMSNYSILVGKTYRTAEGEVRQVTAFEDGEVVYLAVGAPHGPGIPAGSQRISLARFAADAETEVRESTRTPGDVDTRDAGPRPV